MDEAERAVLAGTGLALAALLYAEAHGSRALAWLAKPLASTGFVAFALLSGALHHAYGQAILAGLVLSWLGDVLLLPRGTGASFRAGLGAFLLAHLAYVAAFAMRGFALAWALAAAAIAGGFAIAVLRWLGPRVGDSLRIPVRAYVAVTTLMLAAAAGAHGAGADPRLLAGAGAFYLSDLAVARQRFVAPGFANKAWGLPLYYGGQLLLAASVAS